MTLRSFVTAALILCGACIVPPSSQARDTAVIVPGPDARIMSDYLAGTYARYLQDADAQSVFFQNIFDREPDNTEFGRLALYSALFSGDRRLAKKTADKLYKADSSESMARTILAVDAFSRGRTRRTSKFATFTTSDVTMSLATRLILGWNSVDAGRYDEARKTFGELGGSRYFDALGQLQIAKLEARIGNVDAALAAFDSVEAMGLTGLEYNLSRARFDAKRGETALALDRLNGLIADNPAAEIGPIGDYIERLNAGRKLPRLSIRDEAARAFTEPSFAFFVRNNSNEGGELFLRIATWIEPDFARAKLWLADLIEETRPEATDATRKELFGLYRSISERNPYYVNAKLGEANLYFDVEDDDAAIRILEDIAENHPSFYTRESLGRARFFRENWEEALPFYDALVESLSDEDLAVNPQPLRLRGIIYERLDRWAEAEVDFKRVLTFKADDADTLNYLGYTWVDRGENLEEAFEMIEKAVALEPDSGAITDSLGWAHYKLGNYKQAKFHLENAVVLTPYSATIIDHLGDAYWRLGRKREAQYQWQRALEYDPTDDERDNIELKLASGANAVPAE